MSGRTAATRRIPPRQAHRARSRRPTPLEELGEQLRALTPDDPYAYAVTDLSVDPGAGTTADRWWPVGAVVAAMTAHDARHLRISPAVTGARLVGSLGWATAGRAAVALAVAGRGHDTGPDSLRLRLGDDGLVVEVGVINPRLTVAQGDSPADGDGGTWPDLGAVIGWSAGRSFATLDPLVDEVHELTGYGRVPMWNLVADTVFGPTVTAVGRAGRDPLIGRAVADTYLDALVAHGAPIRRRGTLSPTVGAPVVVRGSCCLYFREGEPRCGTCPLTALPRRDAG